MSLKINAAELENRIAEISRFATVGRCVNGITHDINNLMGAVMAYAELVGLDESLPQDSQEMLEQVIEAAGKCSTLVNSLTVVARPKLENVCALDLTHLVKTVLELRSYEHRTRQIESSFESQGHIPNLIGDMPKLQLMLIHLLLNAMEAVEGCEQKQIKVTLGTVERGAEIGVWNSGSPLTSEECETLFQPLHSTKEGAHAGMGLSAVREIAELHKGTCQYDPEKGFVLYLPYDSGLEYGG
jgi:two-component system, NtrC family, sensor kinase